MNSAGFSTPLMRDLFASLYTCEPETFLFYMQKRKKKGHNKLGDRKQSSPCKSSGVGEGQGTVVPGQRIYLTEALVTFAVGDDIFAVSFYVDPN